MEQIITDNGAEFVIDTKTELTEPDTIYFKNNGDSIAITIEESGGDEGKQWLGVYPGNFSGISEFRNRRLRKWVMRPCACKSLHVNKVLGIHAHELSLSKNDLPRRKKKHLSINFPADRM